MFAILCFGAIDWQKAARAKEVKSWPVADATILKSQIVMSDVSSSTSVGVRTTVAGELRYPNPEGERSFPFFLESRAIKPLDWKGSFKPSGHVPIHYNPENPSELSFVEFTGEP
ncbi:hypothetical protein [Haloferula sp. BvORR071]|uniref:hypothetical protein n=1 Tax=Haloferula sp. BvORR071 TaxID=1396141 RepID=UPI002240FF61|nr:hypothetical protein [Haloferula sp. BvORR071]